LVPGLHPGEERPRRLHGLHPLLSRRRQHERVELRHLLAALGQRLPPRPWARSSLGPERQERGLAQRDRARAGCLGVAVLEFERRAVEAVGEAAVGDADVVGRLASVRDGDLHDAAARGHGEGRVRRDGVPTALGVEGRLIVAGEAGAEGGGRPWNGLLRRDEDEDEEGASGKERGGRHGRLP
jgi:hypothetical protein